MPILPLTRFRPLLPWLALCLSLAAGCAECNAQSCSDGCCNPQGQCVVQPTADAECGLGGGACQNCTPLGLSCVANQCTPRCNAANCAGCCAGTTCVAVPTQTAQRCGTGGGVCTVCAGTCSAGACR